MRSDGRWPEEEMCVWGGLMKLRRHGESCPSQRDDVTRQSPVDAPNDAPRWVTDRALAENLQLYLNSREKPAADTSRVLIKTEYRSLIWLLSLLQIALHPPFGLMLFVSPSETSTRKTITLFLSRISVSFGCVWRIPCRELAQHRQLEKKTMGLINVAKEFWETRT